MGKCRNFAAWDGQHGQTSACGRPAACKFQKSRPAAACGLQRTKCSISTFPICHNFTIFKSLVVETYCRSGPICHCRNYCLFCRTNITFAVKSCNIHAIAAHCSFGRSRKPRPAREKSGLRPAKVKSGRPGPASRRPAPISRSLLNLYVNCKTSAIGVILWQRYR